MSTTFKAIVARNSNGSIELAPVAAGNVPGNIEPGSEVDLTIEVLRTPAQIDDDTQAAKKARGAPVRKPPTPAATEGSAADEAPHTIGTNARKSAR